MHGIFNFLVYLFRIARTQYVTFYLMVPSCVISTNEIHRLPVTQGLRTKLFFKWQYDTWCEVVFININPVKIQLLAILYLHLLKTCGKYFLRNMTCCDISAVNQCDLTHNRNNRKVYINESLSWVLSISPIKCQCCPHIETRQLICTANQLTDFYMRATLALNGLSRCSCHQRRNLPSETPFE